MAKIRKPSRTSTISWMPHEIPSVTEGKSPAMDFSHAMMSGDPTALHKIEQALESQMEDEKEEASLADKFVASTYDMAKRMGLTAHGAKKIEPFLQSYRNDLRKAMRFVLDEDFVRYITEVSSRSTPEKLLYRLQFAHLPYEITWVEFDLQTKVRTMRAIHEMDDSKFNYNEVADRLGLIIKRLSDNEAVVELVCETLGDYGLIGTTICYFFSTREYQFTENDTKGTGCHIIPWENDTPWMGDASLWGYSTEGKSTVIESIAALKTLRMPEFLYRHGVLGTGRMRMMIEAFVTQAGERNVRDTILNLIATESTEFTGMMRWIVTVLAALNEVPISTTRVEPKGSIRIRRAERRPLMTYHKVTLRVPKTNPVQYINRQLGTGKRRMGHKVRQHWRTYLHEEHCLREEHEWIYDHNEGYRLCEKCEAFGRLIHEHVRGDPSLGWVDKSYVVKKSEDEDD